MKVLFIGGTGVISSACVDLAVRQGIDLYLLNRGQTRRLIPPGVKSLTGDIRKPDQVKALLSEHTFDVVVDWIVFEPEHIRTDIELFTGKTGQYIFISTASAYQTPPLKLPITESTPLSNPYWDYSQAKIACEELLLRECETKKFPATIVRPSHTYDKTKLPTRGRYTDIHRMRQGKPVVVHGDGTSIWVLTHHQDFAVGFNGLLGHPKAIGEAFHITSDEWLTWDRIVHILADAAGTTADIVHIPSELIAAWFPDVGPGLIGDKTQSMMFDNSKIKSLVPEFNPKISFEQGAREIMAWFDADPSRQVIDREFDQKIDRLIAAYRSIWPDKKE